jgi:hypothetical protein
VKYTIVGDPHIRPDNLDKAKLLFQLIEDMGNPVIVLGDTFDTKEIIRGKCLNLVYNAVKASRLDWIFLVGNHDLFNLQEPEHSLELLKELPNVTIADKPMTRPGFFFMPYIHDVPTLKSVLSYIPDEAVVVGHFAVKNFDYGNGFISEDELELKDLARFRRVISGHFHKFQEQGNLIYLGTPFSHSFGESNQKKHLGVFDNETSEMSYFPTPFPAHITIEINCSKDSEDSPEWVLSFLDSFNHNRVILTGSQVEIDKVDKTKFPFVKFIEKPNKHILEKSQLLKEEDSNEVKFKKWASEVAKLEPKTIELGLEYLRG